MTTGDLLPAAPDAVVLVHHYHDGSALLSAIGPFPDTDAALQFAGQLGDLAGTNAWTPVPLRTLNPATAAGQDDA